MYGVGVREQLEGRSARYGHAFQLGAGLSAYTSFNLATLAGALLGSTLAETDALGLDFVVPLMFLALLVPLLSTRGGGGGVARRRVAVALSSGVLALLLGRFIPAGATIFLAILCATALRTWLDHVSPDPGEDAKDAR